MFGIEALDVVIGLIFVYLLFSLFVSIINEILSSILQVRGKELKFSIERMIGLKLRNLLYGNSRINKVKYRSSFVYGTPFWGLYKWVKKTISSNVDLGSSEIEKKITNDALPSKISRETFANALLEIAQDEDLRKELFKQAPFLKKAYTDASGKAEEFKNALEDWFDEVMTYTSEWYKQKLRVVLIILGFIIAAFFNVDTFSIVKKLNDDPEARAAIIAQAEQFVESYENKDGRIVLKEGNSDSLFVPNETVISRELKEIKNTYISAYSDSVKKVLNEGRFKGLESEINPSRKDSLIQVFNKTVSDSVQKLAADSLRINYPNLVVIDSVYQQIVRLKQQEISMASSVLGLGWDINTHGSYWKAIKNQLKWYSVFGWLITALAISMGAPFWFDLLKKVINLKNDLKGKSFQKGDGAVG